jgi:adenylate kinase
MKKIVVILYGPPGSGKGTQANLLASKLDIVHFDTGKFLESVVHDPARQKEKIIKRERKLFDGGILMTPSFVLKEVVKAVKKIRVADWGLVFSGSPRTIYEAEGLMPVLERLYDKKNIFVFALKMPADFSVRRNGNRLVCSVCGYTLLAQYYPKVKARYCPVCGGPFYRRTLDNAKTIKVRLKEYTNRTEPIFGVLKKRGYMVREIDAKPAPYKVFAKIRLFLRRADC